MTTFRIIPASDDYPGLTGLRLDEHREIVCLGTGPEVEAALLEAASKRK